MVKTIDFINVYETILDDLKKTRKDTSTFQKTRTYYVSLPKTFPLTTDTVQNIVDNTNISNINAKMDEKIKNTDLTYRIMNIIIKTVYDSTLSVKEEKEKTGKSIQYNIFARDEMCMDIFYNVLTYLKTSVKSGTIPKKFSSTIVTKATNGFKLPPVPVEQNKNKKTETITFLVLNFVMNVIQNPKLSIVKRIDFHKTNLYNEEVNDVTEDLKINLHIEEEIGFIEPILLNDEEIEVQEIILHI